VASLTAWAAAARREAERSRTRASSLRIELRRQLRGSEHQLAQLQATIVAIEQRREGRFQTAWSDLLWRRPTTHEENVLELVDR
jgi:hypothetical protein